MQMTGEQRVEAPRERVFEALNDPEILRRCIPGCESLDKLSDSEMVAKVVAKVGPVKAKFTGQVKISDLVFPESYSISGEGKGGPAGFARGGATVRLEADGSATVMHYEVKADIGGKLAQLGGRLIDGTAKKMAGDFFAKFCELVSADEAAADGDRKAEATPAEPAAAAPKAGGISPMVWVLGIGVIALAAVYLLSR